MGIGLRFNGTDSFCTIPVSVTNASSWEMTIDLVTDDSSSSSNYIYHQSCIFGYDSNGYKSRDFHVDIKAGKLFIFSGLLGNNDSSQVVYGTITNGNGDFGWDTDRFIADGVIHTIRVTYENNTISVYLDNGYLGYLNTTRTINSSELYIGSSYTGEKVYARFDLYNFELKIDNAVSVQYQPTLNTVSNMILEDGSGNNNDGTLSGIFSTVESNFVVVYADTERIIDTAAITFDVDTVRKVRNPLTGWRYENPGTADLLTITGGTTVTNLDESASLTCVAFYQPTRSACFGVAATKELWLRCDIYTTNSYASGNRIRIYSEDNNGVNGFCTQSPTSNKYQIWHNGTSLNGNNVYGKNKMRSFWMHMRSGVTDGVIEVVTGSDSFSYTGNVNAGDDFANLYIQMDGSNIYVSNLIISNGEVEIGEGAHIVYFDTERIATAGTSVTLNVDAERHLTADTSIDFDTSRKISNAITVNADAERKLQNNVTLDFDIVRQIVQAVISVNADFDFERTLVRSEQVSTDIERTLLRGEQVDTDTERKLQNSVTIDFDTERRATRPVITRPDVERVVLRSMEALFDTRRVLVQSVAFYCDVWRQIPHKVNGNTTTLQSVTISLQEQQLTDNVSFVTAEDIEIMEAVDFHIWDYTLRCRAEQTSKRGVLLNCQCTCDIDEILYQQLAYSIPENAFEWTYEYEDAYSNYTAEHPDEEIEKMPSAPASAHITSIASALGKAVSIQFSDWISTMSPEVKTGTNYSGLIEELFGWTARLPHIMINCYMRGDTIYAVQRGHEENTVTLDGLKLTVHTITKKLVRTTWGSDPDNNTEVEPLYDYWASEDLTPWPPGEEPEPGGGGSAVYGDDGLVERTEVVHGEERVVTTYRYEEMGNGQKFLVEEETITYIGGQQVDRTVTTHKPVSYGQSQVYTTDDDGVLGTVVSPTNFDDRVSPYQYGEMMGGGGGYQAAFTSGAHDEYGNYYPAVYSADGTRYLVTGHTGHQKQIGQRTRLNAYALIDTSFPVDGYDSLAYLTEQIKWLDRKTEESVTLELYDYPHLIDFNDQIIWHGNVYYLRSNTAQRTETIVNKQTLEFVRWY